MKVKCIKNYITRKVNYEKDHVYDTMKTKDNHLIVCCDNGYGQIFSDDDFIEHFQIINE